MAIKKTAKGWQADFRPEGRSGKRVRKFFERRRDAEEFIVAQKAAAQSGQYQRPVRDTRRLLDLAQDWYDLHGHTLKDGDPRLAILQGTCTRLGNPVATALTPESFLRYRNARLQEKTRVGNPVTKNSVNHEQAYLSAMFGTLSKLRNWKLANPMKGVPKLKIDEPELIYLELDQIKALLDALEHSRNPDCLAVTKLCLATGARWGEAEALHAREIKGGKVHYYATKNSRSRSLPITPELEAEVKRGRPKVGRLFQPCWHAFQGAIERAGIDLPPGQLTHVLRHTFASHYMINNGNILKLQKALGHRTLAMTMRYAKLAPEHLADVVEKNPLATLESRPQSVHTKARKRVSRK